MKTQRWAVLGCAMVSAVIWSATTQKARADTPNTASMASMGCPAIKSVDFAAGFKLPSSEQMKLWVSGNVAEIYSDFRCEAVCSVKNPQWTRDQVPAALDLECRAGSFGALSTTAAVVWPAYSGRMGHPVGAPTLRFGNWLSGYQDAILQVDLDRLPKAGFERSLAKSQ